MCVLSIKVTIRKKSGNLFKDPRITSKKWNQITKAKIKWLYPTMHMKDQVIRSVFGGTFWTPSDRIPHYIHIVRTYCQPLARSGIFFLLVELVYWLSGLKFRYPTINLAFLRIIDQLDFPRNFVCTVLNDFVSK